ncbi:L-dopachrome tautomerase-related protein [Aliivibrio fischeri]|uniref:L-dopachrome tautomerase-related protein n=1 Tax=Aliivibrio fischeri TaxID=668 RepID=UPI00080E107F|nr:L-dopachrome tautomerase-related protein [Aliivibrio fischeri]OCH08919.1 hypothetical protein A6E11_10965 [Aliivibrio fischeri]OCH31132.1 hypothetical protein A6E13_18405 [Aliivibrio fischeri]
MKKNMLKSLTLLASLFSANLFAANLNIVHELDNKNPPGNIAISESGRLFMSNHHFYGAKNKIVEIKNNNQIIAYPNKKFSQSMNPVLGVIMDKKSVLWMLETADEKSHTGRLIGWDTINNKLHQVIYLAAPIIPADSFLNDLVVDRDNEMVYITDTGAGYNSALIVVDLKTGNLRRVLEGSQYTKPENLDIVIDEKTVMMGDSPARIGVNPITLDSKNEWLYFGAMNGTKLYRIKTEDLRNTELTDKKLEKLVEVYANKPLSDGITIDENDNIYVTDLTKKSIGYIGKDRQYNVLYTDSELLSWSDGFATTNNGKILVTVNKLHKSPVLNQNKDESGNHYYIIEFDALANTQVGH